MPAALFPDRGGPLGTDALAHCWPQAGRPVPGKVFGLVYSHVVLRPRPGYVPYVPTTPFRDQVVNLQALPSEEADPAVLPTPRKDLPQNPVICSTAPSLGQSISVFRMLPPFGQDVASVAPFPEGSLPCRYCQAVTTNRKELKPSFTEGQNPF